MMLRTGLRRALNLIIASASMLTVASALAIVVPGPQILYDGSLGTRPNAQGWIAGGTGHNGETVFGGAVSLDTRPLLQFPNIDLQYGYSRLDKSFDSSLGVDLFFKAQVLSEAHNSNDRAGFSVILLDGTHRGIELGFWENQIFAQNVGFGPKGESTATDTKTSLNEYRLRLYNNSYGLSVKSGASFAQVLGGQMRDYSGVVIPDVYATNNFLFFGDDTRSAAAAFRLASVSMAPIPEPSQAALLAAGLFVVLAYRASRRRVLLIRSQ